MNFERPQHNHHLDHEIEWVIDAWDGTIYGAEVKNMYENGTDYESICDKIGLCYEDYAED